MKPHILHAYGGDYPGHDATGPVRSLRALMAALSEDFDHSILTFDRKFGEREPRESFPGWEAIDHGRRLRIPANSRWLYEIYKAMRDPYGLIVLSSFFDPFLSLPVLQFRRFRAGVRRPTILSPRGEFSPGALELKSAKKRAFIAAANAIGLHKDVWLHATSPQEAQDIEAAGVRCRGVLVAEDTSLPIPLPTHAAAGTGQALRVGFLSRISPIKNLDYALHVLGQVRSPVVFTIYGPKEGDYWDRCEALMQALPPHVLAHYGGIVPNAEVPATLAGQDLFFFPTRGENFGHAIHEALMSGTPVLISDQTPWRGLADAQAGWDLPLADEYAFISTIEHFAALPPEERATWRAGARAYGEMRLRSSRAVEDTKAMFEHVIAERPAQKSRLL